MAKYLITGGAGFIGCNIARELVRLRQEVVVLDNLSTGSLKNLTDIKKRISFIKGDIRDLSTVARAFRGVDYVLHQAALRAVERSVDDPRATNDNNITGTLNVLLAARDSGEYYCRIFNELYNLPTVSLRYFNVFGPYQRPESKYAAVIPIFVRHLIKGQAPDIHWHGRQSRDFTYVDNVVQANLLAAEAKKVKLGEAYNIGNGENTSINELYRALQELLGVAVEPRRTGKRAGDVLKTYADIGRAKRDLSYTPGVSFRLGLKQSIEWYKKNF